MLINLFLSMQLILGSATGEVDLKTDYIVEHLNESLAEYHLIDDIVLYSYGNEDEYEPNQSYDAANNLSDDNYYLLDSYTTNISATLDYKSWIEDSDYYYFKILTDSNVCISIETDSIQSYDFVVENYECYVTGAEVFSYPTAIFEEYGASGNIFFEDTLSPGTYFIYLRGNQDDYENVYDDIEYSLQLSVEKTMIPQSVDIGELKFNKNLAGTVWISDFIPTNDLSNIEYGTDLLYYKKSNQETSYPNYALDDLMEISNGGQIRVATIYLWDPIIRYSLFEILSAITEELENNIQTDLELSLDLTLQKDYITNGLVIAGKLTDLLPIRKEIKSIANLLGEISLNCLEQYFDMLIPKHDISFTAFTSYISSLTTALYMNPNEINNIDDLDQFKTEIIQIPIFYQLYEKDNIVPNNIERYIKFSIPLSSQNDYFRYEENTIISNPIDSYYCRGKFYALFKDDNMDLANLQLVYALPDAIPNYKEALLYSNEIVRNLEHGEYKWFKFEVPNSGRYYFKCTNVNSVYIELFTEIVTGYSSENLLYRATGGFIHYSTFEEKGCYFDYYLNSGDVIYIRIRNEGFEQTNHPDGGMIFEISDQPDNEAHIHSYIYNWFNTTHHIASCLCGDYHSEGHVVSGVNTTRCIVCGGKVTAGIVQPFNLGVKYKTENGSYILSNGIVVLVEEDIENYFKGILVFESNSDNNHIKI